MSKIPLPQQFLDNCAAHSVQRWIVALSGGLDSMVLLHLASTYLPAGTVRAIHVNHHLQKQSDEWAEFCLAQCKQLSIPIEIVDVYPVSSSELDARDARLSSLEERVALGEGVLMAHHADDQAETILFRFARGSGLKGLGGIPPYRPFGPGIIVRPLLDASRITLERWAKENALLWIDDPSNAVDGYDRNYLRLHVLPLLKQRWPKVIAQFGQAAKHLREQQALLNSYLDKDLFTLRLSGGGLDLSLFSAYDLSKRTALLRRWYESMTGSALNEAGVDQILNHLVSAREDAEPEYCHGLFTLRRYRNGLYCLKNHEAPTYSSRFERVAVVPGETDWNSGTLTVTAATEGLLSLDGLEIASRQEGMTIKPYGRPTKTLKKLFQEAGIPPWLRSSWPIIVCKDEVISVPGICIAEGWWAKSGEKPVFSLSWRAL